MVAIRIACSVGSAGPGILPRAMTRRIVEAAVGAANAAAGAARHLLWYLSYRMDGSARTDEDAGDPPRAS